MKPFRGCTILLIGFLGLSKGALGNPPPSLPDPGTGSLTAFTAIASDFGPRNIDTAGATNPHGGIDYAIAAGGGGHAVAGGAITAIIPTGPNALIQVATNWEYIHMEYAGPHVTAVSHDGGTVLVFRNGINQPIVKVLGVPRTPPVVWPLYEGFPVVTSVSTSDWIYAVRADHLHLEYRNGLENPLKNVVHDYASDDPIITPRYKYIDSAGLAQNFAENTIYNCGDNPAILQAGVDVRTNKDLNSVEIFVKPLIAETYASLNKWIYEPDLTPQFLPV